MAAHYDVIIIGSGAGGGTLALKLAPSGKKVLLLERGPFLPREKENWDTIAVAGDGRYHTTEVWYDKHGKAIHPGTGYWVGGNTKVYGAALLRLREKDFAEVRHRDGTSPAWPISYADLEPYYSEAERIYEVRGERGSDPGEPWAGAPYPNAPVPHEPRIAEIDELLRAKGYHPFPLPLGVRLQEPRTWQTPCIRCDKCDGFPCLVDAKCDADTACVRPAMAHPNVELVTEATVELLETDDSGRTVTGVVAAVGGERVRYTADLVVVAGGAINSAVLLLRSANAAHPAGIGNGNDLVGRFFMKHNNTAMAAIGTKRNPTVFQKTLGLTDFYWGDDRFAYPLGSVQLLGKLNKDFLRLDAPPFTPDKVLEEMAAHSVDWFLTSEDLPEADNRIRLDGERIVVDYTENNQVAFKELSDRFVEALKAIDCANRIIPSSVYLKKNIPIEGVAHQVGTCRFGTDPASSVLDVHCRVHALDNLYVVDGSFFPSSGAVNPSLTIMANALRVGNHLLERLGASAASQTAAAS